MRGWFKNWWERTICTSDQAQIEQWERVPDPQYQQPTADIIPFNHHHREHELTMIQVEMDKAL
ncbi:hypothetical protein PP744_gp010 [Rhizobium phage RHph_N38]|uniref:Uncharacterized protein n=1 Tax=Rhizobium phage RHph_N38 TaxID=2509750 RepID=A0A7S5UUM4_9CAUD|nr:hypothetical protein PP744_gp010 [Rhizobium phage RHph_N38]QIG70473.1 hypothetical protein EVB89_010 [Rhizobium phage RHph_N38]